MKDYAVKVENISKIYELKNKNNQYKKDDNHFDRNAFTMPIHMKPQHLAQQNANQ